MTDAEKALKWLCGAAKQYDARTAEQQYEIVKAEIQRAALKAQEKPVEVTVKDFMEIFVCGNEDARNLMKMYPNGVKIIDGGENG